MIEMNRLFVKYFGKKNLGNFHGTGNCGSRRTPHKQTLFLNWREYEQSNLFSKTICMDLD
jgi:hypothetical protein